MKEQIIQHLDNPKELEALYRQNKAGFKKTFNQIYEEIKDAISAQIWFERLNFKNEALITNSKIHLPFVIILAILAGFVAKLPDIFIIRPDFFYQRNVGFIIFPDRKSVV